MPARFHLPERVDDRAFAFADVRVVPVPSLGVDRLTHRPQQLQRRQVVLFNQYRPLTRQRPDRGRCGIVLVDLVFGAHLPEPARIGIVRHAFKHRRLGPVRLRPIDDIAVPRDPAYVSGTPEDVAVMVIELIWCVSDA